MSGNTAAPCTSPGEVQFPVARRSAPQLLQAQASHLHHRQLRPRPRLSRASRVQGINIVIVGIVSGCVSITCHLVVSHHLSPDCVFITCSLVVSHHLSLGCVSITCSLAVPPSLVSWLCLHHMSLSCFSITFPLAVSTFLVSWLCLHHSSLGCVSITCPLAVSPTATSL